MSSSVVERRKPQSLRDGGGKRSRRDGTICIWKGPCCFGASFKL